MLARSLKRIERDGYREMGRKIAAERCTNTIKIVRQGPSLIRAEENVGTWGSSTDSSYRSNPVNTANRLNRVQRLKVDLISRRI